VNKRKINLSYIAGLFDGEGCITTSKVMKYNPTMKKSYLCNAIRMELCNTDFRLVDICYQFFKEGHICHIKPRKKGYKPQQRWQLTHRQAYRVLKKLLPYLNNKDKIEKGEKIINYYEVEQKI
jgi:hypothetical protein